MFIICFSVINPDSLHNAREKWHEEINNFCPKARYLLVGTKIDLRDNLVADSLKQRKDIVTYEQGKEMALEIQASDYVECSSLTRMGLKTVFDEAVLAALKPPDNERRKFCALL